MIDLNELRRLAQGQEWIGRWYDAGCETLMAERNGEHEEVAHPYPIGLVPYLVAVQPTAVSYLLDRLEAAEKAASESYQRGYETGQEEIEKERDALRAKIEAMEKQEPECEVVGQVRNVLYEVRTLKYDLPAGTKLYALPGAQPELNLSDPAVQKRLAAQWGYVPAPENCPCCEEPMRVYSRCSNSDCEAVTVTPEQARHNKALAFARTVAT